MRQYATEFLVVTCWSLQTIGINLKKETLNYKLLILVLKGVLFLFKISVSPNNSAYSAIVRINQVL